MKKAIVIALSAGLGLTGLLMFAQDAVKPHDPARRIERHIQFLTKALSLTSDQQQQATTIFTNAANAEKGFHDQMQTAHESLQAAVQKNDSAGIDQAANTLGSLTGQMAATHAKARAAFLQTLTPDQQSKLKEFESHGHGRHMRGPHGFGPGGPRGPGGPPAGGPQD